MQFRKKPVVIEAEQWFEVTYDREAGHGITPEDMPIYHLGVGYYRRPEGAFSGENVCPYCEKPLHIHGWIDTIQGGHVVCPGDWIIKDDRAKERHHGHFYPCKPDIFAATYEAVE